ncbi:acyltransferase [Tropicibacter naphthalenivorans]|uniref:Putative acetyltransferase n=1 Tax=Tropicibacter naphthalenivorans TaxID=441103 RepID=A0A0P1H031_9RHOB|nr:acyltransferase [Tropicibacter naphthalenivorans]CUH82315.1 Putative acetyltransferase [Tropicibacter naphthalenivorans]SMD05596.1 Hexapeptide repeat of succinyl-transferase [Tropicibacter naphthalenivorans]
MANDGGNLMFVFRLRNLICTRVFRLLFARRFAAFGRGTNVLLPDGIEGAQNISLGDGVLVGARTLLAARPIVPGGRAALKIGSGTLLGRANHIYATGSIEIGEKVLTANNVYIADNRHGYEDPDTPVMDQPVIQLAPTRIGDGTWLGHGACVVGAQVGRGCVIGAGAFVTTDIPDRCVVVGAPARIVKRFDPDSGTWRSTHPDGTFRPNQTDPAHTDTAQTGPVETDPA